jgi:hypothetical protein
LVVCHHVLDEALPVPEGQQGALRRPRDHHADDQKNVTTGRTPMPGTA